MIVMDVISR